ncbi:MAG: class I SAM-dependent methyltransferase [bacterium]|nr:class I SAM-dependent methyltransferase [bacterium]
MQTSNDISISKTDTSSSAVCPICHDKDLGLYTEKSGFKFWRSKNCGLIFLSPLPKESPADVYGSDYFSGAKEGFGYVNYDQDKSAMESLFKKFLKLMTDYIPSRGRLLDVGAATGYFVDLANKEGWLGEGIDISAYAAEEGRKKGLKIDAATLHAYHAPDGTFAAITMWDVLEHLPDPEEAAKKIHALLKPGGVFAINTPDSDSLWAKIWRGKWQALHPPEHMIIFNKKALELLLNNSGFEVLAVSNPNKKFTPAYILQLFSNSTGIPLPSALIDMLNKKPFNTLAIPIPIRDNVFVLARKK